jgi:hypothetical protein
MIVADFRVSSRSAHIRRPLQARSSLEGFVCSDIGARRVWIAEIRTLTSRSAWVLVCTGVGAQDKVLMRHSRAKDELCIGSGSESFSLMVGSRMCG